MIKFIQTTELLNIRNIVLRGGILSLDECRFPTDNVEGAFHLGYYIDAELAAIASFAPHAYDGFSAAGYQLRGMATVEKYRCKGYGNQLLNFGLVYLRGRHVDYLWCNARKAALQFYLNMGFEVISPEFDVPVIGPHYVLYVKIQ